MLHEDCVYREPYGMNRYGWEKTNMDGFLKIDMKQDTNVKSL